MFEDESIGKNPDSCPTMKAYSTTDNKEGDEFEMTPSQESQLLLEPTNVDTQDYYENCQELSDEDGADVNLIKTCTR